MKLNGLEKEFNRSLAIEFYANAYQGRKKKYSFMLYVRWKEIWFDEDTINELLGTPTPLVCRVETRREDIEDVKHIEDIGILEEIKD